jgi:crotonobetainyl-CoA:carnitine CoA-transferase CaiB-like acyl-CoA transferase
LDSCEVSPQAPARGTPVLSSDPRFFTNRQRNAHRDELKELLEAKLMLFDCEPQADRLVRASVPCAPIHDVPVALADPHTKHRGMVVEIGDGYRGVASPINLSRTPATYRVRPPKRDSWQPSAGTTGQTQSPASVVLDVKRNQWFKGIE